ncbi:hypothetical protein HID58_065056, partial [Brassica napus]
HLIRRLSRVADSSTEFSLRRSTFSFRTRRGHHRFNESGEVQELVASLLSGDEVIPGTTE